MSAGIIGQPNVGSQDTGVSIPALFQPLEKLGVKLSIKRNIFDGPRFKTLKDRDTAKLYLDRFIGRYSGVAGQFRYQEYMKVLLDMAVAWGLIDKSVAAEQKSILEEKIKETPEDQLYKMFGIPEFPEGKKPAALRDRLHETIIIDTQMLAGKGQLRPVRNLIERLPEDSKIRAATLGYLNFRDLSNREQWKGVKTASLLAAVRAGKAIGETKDRALAIFGEGYEWFWDKTKFGMAIKAERDKALVLYRKKVIEPVKEVGVKLDTKFVAPVREEIIKPIDVYGKAFFKDIKIQSQEHTEQKKWKDTWDSLSRANETLAKDGPIRSAGDYIVSLRRKKRNGQGLLQGFNIVEIAVNSAIKAVVGTIRGAITVVKPLNQVATAARQFTQERISAVKAGFSSVVRPWMASKWNGLTSFVSKTANVVRTGFSLGRNVVGALGDAAAPVAILALSGNPVAAAVVGTLSFGASVTARTLNSGIVPASSLQRGLIYRFGSLEGREAALLQNIKTNAPGWYRSLSPSQISKLTEIVKARALEMGGTSRVFMGANATKAFMFGASLGFAIGGPAGALALGTAFAGANYGMAALRNAFRLSETAKLLNTYGFFKLPANQVLGAYFGGKWLEEQIRKMFTNKNYLRDEWLNLSLNGGLGNTITLVSSTASVISVGRWALNGVNEIGGSVAFKAIGGAATVARAMGTGSLIGSLLGAGIGALIFNIAPGVGAIVGGFVGGVAGGMLGAAAAAATGGAATPAVFFGSLGGSALGAFLGTGLDWLIDSARRAAEAFANFLGILSIAKFLATLATVLTAPLRKLTDYVELVVPIALGLITITMISLGSSQNASNTPVSAGAGSGTIESENVIASIISPFISDISTVSKEGELEISTSGKVSAKSCYGSSSSNYYLKENGRYVSLKKNHGLTLSGNQKVSTMNPIETTVFFNGESPLYVKSDSGEFIKSGEKALVLTPNTLTSSYFILIEGITSELNVGDKVKEDYLLGETTGTDFRISILTEADSTKYDPEKTIDPCSESSDINFPGFTCDIIPQFQEICVND